MQNKYMRTVDEEIYLKNKRFTTPKENFKQIASILNLAEVGGKTSLLDIGCATGEFLYYVRHLNENIMLNGIEFSETLVNESLELLSENNINISVGDANNLLAVDDNSYDFVTTIGVTSIFDDFRPSFNEMIRVAKPQSLCLNHMLLNEMDIDVIIRYLKPDYSVQESGWNKFSIKSVEQHLHNCKAVK